MSRALRRVTENLLGEAGRVELSRDWKNLGDAFVGGIGDLVPPDTTCVIVPHGTAHGLPVHALPFEGKPWVCRNPFAYVPSFSILRRCRAVNPLFRRGEAPADVASFGVDFEEEAAEVAQIFGGSATQGSEGRVTCEVVRKQSGSKQVLHFSCHGAFLPTFRLRIGDSAHYDELRHDDVMTLDLSECRLVTLSACETGRYHVHGVGEEMFGFLTSFFMAGAPSVLASLWRVPGDSTRRLMATFYREWLSGKNKSEALRLAQLEAMASGASLERWGGFAVYGDWI